MRWRINFGAGMPYVNYHSSSLVFELPRNEWTRVSDSAVAIQSMLGCQKDRWSRILGCRKSMALRVLDLEQYPTLQRIAAQCSWRHIVDGFHTVGQFWNTIFWDDNIDILVNYYGTIILANYNIYIYIYEFQSCRFIWCFHLMVIHVIPCAHLHIFDEFPAQSFQQPHFQNCVPTSPLPPKNQHPLYLNGEPYV